MTHFVTRNQGPLLALIVLVWLAWNAVGASADWFANQLSSQASLLFVISWLLTFAVGFMCWTSFKTANMTPRT